jgi:phage gp36-like protein
VRRRYDDAIRFLERLADGRIGLGVAPTAATGGPDYEAPERVFDADSLDGY